jgi:hypothetical protein
MNEKPPTALLRSTLQIAVPLWMHEVRRLPEEERIASAHGIADVIASKGDVLQFGGKKGEAAKAFNELARGLAILSFAPGGVWFLGDHWEANPPPAKSPMKPPPVPKPLKRKHGDPKRP